MLSSVSTSFLSKYFWKYRHWLHPAWTDGYKDLMHPHRKQVKELVFQHDPKLVFEFGCGVGANLVNIALDSDIACIGTDISKKAIEEANKWVECLYFGKNMPIFTHNSLWHVDRPDIWLTDAVMIYLPPKKAEDLAVAFFKSATAAIIHCELVAPDHYKHEVIEGRYGGGYHAYDYEMLYPDATEIFTYPVTWPESVMWEKHGRIVEVVI